MAENEEGCPSRRERAGRIGHHASDRIVHRIPLTDRQPGRSPDLAPSRCPARGPRSGAHLTARQSLPAPHPYKNRRDDRYEAGPHPGPGDEGSLKKGLLVGGGLVLLVAGVTFGLQGAGVIGGNASRSPTATSRTCHRLWLQPRAASPRMASRSI